MKPYARARLDALGYKEWADGFNAENIPKSLLNTAYFIELGTVAGVRNNQADLEVMAPFRVDLFLRGGRDPKAAIDSAAATADTVIVEFCKAANRCAQTSGIKNILFDTLEIIRLDGSNDNSLINRFQFRAFVEINAR